MVYGFVLVLLVMGYAAVKRARGEVVELEAARQALAQGDSESAIRRLSGLRDSADNSTVQSLLATAYSRKKQYAQAEDCYRRTLQLDPRNFAARSGLGALLASTGRLKDAVKELQKAARLNPGSAGIWLQLGTALQNQGRHAEAISALQNAVVLNPKSVQAEFSLGISEMNLRQYEAAIAAFQKASWLAPDNYEAQIWLANAYQAAGRANDAAAAYVRGARLRPRVLVRPRSLPAH